MIALGAFLAVGPSFLPGKSAYEGGRMQEARDLLEQAVAEAPQEAEPYLYRALARVELGDSSGARGDFDRALDLRPGSAMGHHYYGDLLLSAGDLDAAELHLRRALDVDPGYARARYRMGDLFRRRGKIDEAIASYERSAREDPSGSGWHSVGDVLLERGDHARAVEAFEKDLIDHPDCYEARIDAAALYLGDGDAWRAAEHYGESLRYHPGDPRATKGLRHAHRTIAIRWLLAGGLPALGLGTLLGFVFARRGRRAPRTPS